MQENLVKDIKYIMQYYHRNPSVWISAAGAFIISVDAGGQYYVRTIHSHKLALNTLSSRSTIFNNFLEFLTYYYNN